MNNIGAEWYIKFFRGFYWSCGAILMGGADVFTDEERVFRILTYLISQMVFAIIFMNIR